MSRRLFGTDGIRARFGAYPLNRPTVTALGRRLADRLERTEAPPQVVLGGDTRSSTPALVAWLAAGLRDGGARVRFAGTVPTPAVAFLVRQLGADAGIAVSASHNPSAYNGLKLFDRDGYKWSTAEEQRFERQIPGPGELPEPAGEATLPQPEPALAAAYLDHLRASVGAGRPLAGLELVVDAANGAAAPYAEELFAALGARPRMLGDAPDGKNINLDCGSTAPAALTAATIGDGRRLGIAFDGDADRALFADGTGELRDGDAVLYLWASWLDRHGKLEPRRIVATSMSNLGLERALAVAGIEVVRCDVGDREVVETMRREGIRLGGEQSGHLVHLDLGTTGDGLLTALQIAAMVAAEGRPLEELLRGFRRFPQVLLNVPVASKPRLDSLPEVAAAAREVRGTLGEEGRLVLRYSGTEPLARVMIEGPEDELIRSLARRLAQAIAGSIGSAESEGAA